MLAWKRNVDFVMMKVFEMKNTHCKTYVNAEHARRVYSCACRAVQRHICKGSVLWYRDRRDIHPTEPVPIRLHDYDGYLPATWLRNGRQYLLESSSIGDHGMIEPRSISLTLKREIVGGFKQMQD